MTPSAENPRTGTYSECRVYVLRYTPDEATTILGIFSSYEKAQHAERDIRNAWDRSKNWYDHESIYIDTYPIDSVELREVA